MLLFVKYVSDRYAGQRYAPITIPAGASFAEMVALKGKSDIGERGALRRQCLTVDGPAVLHHGDALHQPFAEPV